MDPVVNLEGEVVTDPLEIQTVVTDPVVPETKPGEKTDPAKLLESLQEERAKRKEAENRLKILQETPQNSGVVSDEGKFLLKEITDIRAESEERKAREALETLQRQYPAIKDKAAEFEQYVSENDGIPLAVAAKAFLVDNNLFTQPTRKGLEKGTGGTRAPQSTGMTPEEIDDLRNTNYRKFSDMVRKGQIKV